MAEDCFSSSSFFFKTPFAQLLVYQGWLLCHYYSILCLKNWQKSFEVMQGPLVSEADKVCCVAVYVVPFHSLKTPIC